MGSALDKCCCTNEQKLKDLDDMASNDVARC